MNIGICAENRPQEKRVILLPRDVKDLLATHTVFVERGAGKGIGIADSEYENVGAKVVDQQIVYSCSLVVRLKEPKEEELAMMREGSVMFSMMHLPGNPALRGLLEKYGIIAIAMEEIKDPFGVRKIEALHQVGYLAMEKAFELWGGVQPECSVKVMGYGNAACGAIQCAARKFARVTILHKQDFEDMAEHIPDVDILVNAINWPHAMRGKKFIVTKGMLKLFKKGAVIVDLISNPPGKSPIETMHPTTLDDISYSVDDVIHSSCWGWPGLDPVNISKRYSIQVAPIVNEIADCGVDNLPQYIQAAMHRD